LVSEPIADNLQRYFVIALNCDRAALVTRQRADDLFETVFDVVVDQRLLGLCNGSFVGMRLLGNLKARPLRFDHVDNAAEVTFGAPQAPDDFGMAVVDWVRIHD
jgi:hypothetical protein